MGRFSVGKALAALLFVMAVASCGEQGDPGPPGTSRADFVSVSVDNGPLSTFTETAAPGTHYGVDPYVATVFDSTNSQMYLYVLADYAGGAYQHRMTIVINGSRPGEYTVAGGSRLSYTPAGSSYSAGTGYPPSEGTITVTRFDDPEGLVEGSYDVTAVAGGAATARLTGSFSVTRD